MKFCAFDLSEDISDSIQASPFPTAPPRTVLAAFTAHGSPVLNSLSSSLLIKQRCISHHCLAPLPENLSPFPLYLAFPGSPVGRHSYEYYGDSVALGLSTGRRSRILVTFDVSARRACFSSNPLSRGHSPQGAFC